MLDRVIKDSALGASAAKDSDSVINLTTRFEQIIDWFESLTPETLLQINTIYSASARFRDPFNTMTGLAGVTRVYQHMFDSLQHPRFVITNTVLQGVQAFVSWDFNFELRGRSFQIEGCTQFVLNAQGLIETHRDYWDVAEELYEKIPVLGSLMRFLKRKLAVQTSD
jgi:hypothetical protein